VTAGRKIVYGKILVPLDGSELAEKVLPYVEELARQFKSEVLLLLVMELAPERLGVAQGSLPIEPETYDEAYKDSRDYLARVQESLSRIGVASSIHLLWGHIASTIVEFAMQERVQLIAMTSHGRSGLARVYYGSVAAAVLHRIDRPLLLVRSA
jgi:nucleotide-binding universal stress UspA family protein